MELLQNLRQQLTQIWQGMSLPRRIALGSVAALSLAVIAAVGYWTMAPEYRVVYTQLAPEDAGGVTSALESLGIPYTTRNGGATILVPEQHVDEARMQLAVKGLPARSGKGFEIMDNFSLGMSAKLQHVNYIRALQGELARTIMQLESVMFARVHVVIPKKTVFDRKKKPATASVLLRLHPNASMNRRGAHGIAHLIAHAVEGLSAENVTLLDAQGRRLPSGSGEGLGAVSWQEDIKRDTEAYLSQRAQDMLGRFLGPNRAIVRVSAQMNFQKVKKEELKYDPENKVAKRIFERNSKSVSNGLTRGGPAGTASNLASQRTSAAAGGAIKNDSQETDSGSEYAIPSTKITSESPYGNIERLSVAAVVDLSAAKGADGKEVAPNYTAKDLEALIKSAVNFQERRDLIKVTEGKLVSEEATLPGSDEFAAMQSWQTTLSLIRSGAIGLVAVVILLLGWLFLRNLRSSKQPAPVADAPTQSLMAKRVLDMAQENPQVLAKVLSGWLENSSNAQTSTTT